MSGLSVPGSSPPPEDAIRYHASAMRAPRWLLAIWLCFLARAFFYGAALPLWEGYDEWSHFAVVQRMAFRGEPLVSRFSQIPRDVAASLQLAPVSWECRYLPPPSATHHHFPRPAPPPPRAHTCPRPNPPNPTRAPTPPTPQDPPPPSPPPPATPILPPRS